jgi:hypothetical protein
MRILRPRICSLSSMTVPIRKPLFLEICKSPQGIDTCHLAKYRYHYQVEGVKDGRYYMKSWQTNSKEVSSGKERLISIVSLCMLNSSINSTTVYGRLY